MHAYSHLKCIHMDMTQYRYSRAADALAAVRLTLPTSSFISTFHQSHERPDTPSIKSKYQKISRGRPLSLANQTVKRRRCLNPPQEWPSRSKRQSLLRISFPPLT